MSAGGSYPAGELDIAMRFARREPEVAQYLSEASACLRFSGDFITARLAIEDALAYSNNQRLREILEPVVWTLQKAEGLHCTKWENINLRSAAEMQPILDLPWLIQGVLLANSNCLLFGASHVGKSFINVDWSIRLCHGITFGNRRVEKCNVLYLNGEGFLDNRIAAACRNLGVDAPDNLHISDGIAPLCDAGAADWLGNLLDQTQAAVVFIDTWHRALGGEDGSADGPTGRALRTLSDARAMYGDVAFILTHHPGKDSSKGPRGSSALHAAMDTELQAAGDNGSGELSVTKQRDGKRDIVFPFDLQEVEIGHSRWHDPVTSMIVDWRDEAREPMRGKSKSDNLPADARRAYDALVNTVASQGEEPAGNVPAPGMTLVVPERAWRDAYFAARGADSQDTKDRSFRRAKERLQNVQLIALHDPWVWLTKEKVARCDFVHR